MNSWVYLGPVLGILGLIVFLLLLKPLGRLLALVGRMCLGLLSLLALNLIGTPLGLAVGVNLVTVLTAAVLGLPGVTALAVSRLILKL